jgi:hypothetical protein
MAQRRFCRLPPPDLFIGLLRRGSYLPCPGSQAEKDWAQPVGAGNTPGDLGQRVINFALVVEPMFEDGHGMNPAVPLAYQPRPGLQGDDGHAGRIGFACRRLGESAQAALCCRPQAAMDALLNVISNRAGQQIAAQPRRRLGVVDVLPFPAQITDG